MSYDLRDAMEFIEALVDEARVPNKVEIDGKIYYDKKLNRYGKKEIASALTACTLTSMIDYISRKSGELRESMIIHVESPTRVRLFSGLDEDRDREELFKVETYPNGFQFDRWYDQESFIINMQTAFVQTEETAIILAVAGNVESKTVANYGDDGTSQSATISRGIAGKESVLVPNPVTLRPFRTFLEVKQPESKFVFRIGDKEVPAFKLVEADGGIWKYDAVSDIKKYLIANIPEDLKERIAVIG